MNERADSVTVTRMSRPPVTSIMIGALFVAVAAFYLRLAIDLTPEENAYRRLVMGVISFVIILLGVFIHLYIFRKTAIWLDAYRNRNSAQLRPGFLQDVWVEINNYPVKFCAYTFGYAMYGVVLFTGLFILVPFVIHSISSLQYLAHLFVAVSLIAWPMATLQYFVLERNQRRLAGVFLSENASKIRLNDPRIIRFSVRTKLLVAFFTTTGMASLFVGATMYYSVRKGPDELVWNLMAAVAIAIGYGLAVSILTSRSVSDSINGIENSVRTSAAPAKGQSDWFRIPTGFSTDELGFLYSSLTQFFETFRVASRQMQNDVQELERRTQDIIASAHSQRTAANHHGEAVTHTAGSLEELTESLNQVTSEGEQVSDMIRRGLGAAASGKEKMEKTLLSIEQIRQEATQNSKRVMDLSLKMMQIEEVIKIINYVTDQTKILAFNASIETAGAGEMGERFGVVAKEIRQLAQNIAHSTDEIKKIIDDVRRATHGSVLAAEKELKQIQSGLQSGGEAHEAFFEIFDIVRQASEAMTGITQALTQQRVAHEQVWNSLRNLDRNTRETLDHNRAITQASDSILLVSKDLSHSVSSLSNHPSVHSVKGDAS